LDSSKAIAVGQLCEYTNVAAVLELDAWIAKDEMNGAAERQVISLRVAMILGGSFQRLRSRVLAW